MKQLEQAVLIQYLDENRHLGRDKTYDTTACKYCWPNLFKCRSNYVEKCHVCRVRNRLKIQVPMHKTDIPPYPMAKQNIDFSIYRDISSKQVFITLCWLFNMLDWSFSHPQSVQWKKYLLYEIISWFSVPLAIVTDTNLHL